MVNINRVQSPSTTSPAGKVSKKFKQDSPEPGVVYGDVHRSEGDAEETIQAILYFAKRQVQEKRGGKDGQKKKQQQGKKKDKERFDEDKTYMIASPVPESMVQPRQNGCAPTCLAMLLRKYGIVNSVKAGYQRVESLRTAGADYINDTGLTLEDINTYAQQAGLKARVQRGYNFIFQLEGLLRSLNRGATPIASIQLPGMGSMRHAVLIVGVTQHEVTIVDPAKPDIQKVPMVDFQLCWQKEEPGQAGVGLAYIEVWGENARGEVIQSEVSWDTIIEELYRDGLMFSEIASANARSSFPPNIVSFFEEEDRLSTDATKTPVS